MINNNSSSGTITIGNSSSIVDRVYSVTFNNGLTMLVHESDLSAAARENNGIAALSLSNEKVFKPSYINTYPGITTNPWWFQYPLPQWTSGTGGTLSGQLGTIF